MKLLYCKAYVEPWPFIGGEEDPEVESPLIEDEEDF